PVRPRQPMNIPAVVPEPLGIGNHPRNLGLPPPDFPNPDAVGIHILLPGQVLAAMLVVPGQHGAGEGVSTHRPNSPLSASRTAGALSPNSSSNFSPTLSCTLRSASLRSN